MLKTIAKAFFNAIPSRSRALYRIAERYVDRYNGDNNSNSHTNGEESYLLTVLPTIPGGTVFDVGANVGNWSKFCLSIEPSLLIHLFEPTATTYEKLESRQWPSTARLNRFGLGERREQLSLHVVDAHSGMSTLHRRHGVLTAEAGRTEMVEIKTLDSYCHENEIAHIDLLKLDVEGHELAVLRGSKAMFARDAIDRVQFEYGGCNLDARVRLFDLWEFLTNYGFQISKLFPSGLRTVPTYSQALETFKYSNWVAHKTR